MPTGPSSNVTAIRAHVRESERAARGLIARAAHLEKRASRLPVDCMERSSLEARAHELRADARAFLAEVSELSGHIAAA